MEQDVLQRYIEGNVTTEEIEAVVDWLDVKEEHVKEYRALHKLYALSLFNKPEGRHVALPKKGRMLVRTWVYEWAKIAAIVLLVWGGMTFFAQRGEEEEAPPAFQTLFVPAGQRAELTLPDGSKVWL
ncbi:MAG: anti-sigma factor, partial [Tannerellaceae bacterium]|nr:anti-sigma factor [Tannerellaceae bacterium]